MRAVAALTLLFATVVEAQDGGVRFRPIRWDVPQVIEESEVPERLHAIDYPVTVRAVKTRLKPRALVDFFFDQFEKAGLYINPEEHTPKPLRALSITGLDTAHLISYTIIFQGNPDDTTTAIMTETYLGERRKQPEPKSAAALFPAATDVVRSGSEGIFTVTYSAPAKPDDVTTFYRDVLPRSGFKEVEPGVFEKGPERLEVFIRKGKTESSAVVTLVQRAGP